jgi:hypothetical protein
LVLQSQDWTCHVSGASEVRILGFWRKLFEPPKCKICGGEASHYSGRPYCVDCEIKRIDKIVEILSRHKAEIDELPREEAGQIINKILKL